MSKFKTLPKMILGNMKDVDITFRPDKVNSIAVGVNERVITLNMADSNPLTLFFENDADFEKYRRLIIKELGEL